VNLSYKLGDTFHTGLMVGFSKYDLYYWGFFQNHQDVNLSLSRSGGLDSSFSVSYNNPEVILRIRKDGNNYHFEYKAKENSPWKLLKSQICGDTPEAVGLIVRTWLGTAIKVDFDYLKILSSGTYTNTSVNNQPTEGIDKFTISLIDEFNGASLNKSWLWYRPNAGPRYSLDEKPGFLHITVPNDRPYRHEGQSGLSKQFTRIARGQSIGRVDTWGGFWSYITGDQWHGFGPMGRNSLTGGIGLPLVVLSLAGLIYCLITHTKESLLLASLPIVLYSFLGNLSYKVMRHLLPVVPFLTLFAAQFIYVLIYKLRVLEKKKNIVSTAIVLIIVLPMLFDSIRHDYMITQKDTRTLAKVWIEKNLPSGSKIAVEAEPPQLYNSNDEFTIIAPKYISKSSGDLEREGQPKFYYLLDTRWALFKFVHLLNIQYDIVERLKQDGAEYVVVDNWTYSVFYEKRAFERYPERVKQRQMFYEWLDAENTLVKRFDPIPYKGPGPIIKIYKMNWNNHVS